MYIRPIPIQNLGLCMNSDATLHLIKAKERPQGGYVIVACDKVLGQNVDARAYVAAILRLLLRFCASLTLHCVTADLCSLISTMPSCSRCLAVF